MSAPETREVVHRAGSSPFDALRRFDEHGEHWMAREITEPLGYTWRRFTDAIERGRTALRVNGQDPDLHIRQRSEPSNGFGRAETRTDFRMTREGVYATIQGGDPRKPEIAAAWAYFRVRTREAEALEQLTPAEILLRQAQQLVDQERRIRAVSTGLADVTARVDAIEGRTGWWIALAFTKRRGLPTDHSYLLRLGKRAAAVARASGVEPVKTDSVVYGTVNSLPEWAWEQAAGEIA